MEYDIHNYEEQLHTALHALATAPISQRNKQLILEFKRHLIVTDIGTPRITRYVFALKMLARVLDRDFDQATKDDMMRVIEHLQTCGYKEWTKKTYKGILKRFYKWLKGNDTRYPPEVEWISTGLPRSKRPVPKPEDLLVPNEIPKLIDVCHNLRDKALIALLWETGARISEVGNLTAASIAFDEYGGTVQLNGKTGPRRIRIISSVPFLANWLSTHPLKHTKTAPLWCCLHRHQDEQLNYKTIAKMLQNMFQKAGIDKKCNPHIFRHSRATFMAKHLTEFQMNQYFGWVQGSAMPSTYVHLSGKDMDAAVLKLNGIEIGNNESDTAPQATVCVRCKRLNPTSAELCCACGMMLESDPQDPENVPSTLRHANQPQVHTVLPSAP